METLVLLLLLSIGLQASASDLDTAFQSFLKSASSARSSQDHSTAIKNLFALHQKEFNGQPKTAAEQTARYAAFKETINALLKESQQDSQTYAVRLNEFADKTADELKSFRGLRPPKSHDNKTSPKVNQNLIPLNENRAQGRATTVPASYDYTTRVVSGTTTPIVIRFPSFFF